MKNNKNNSSVPVKFYPNSDIWKVNILSENTNKAGIYMWTKKKIVCFKKKKQKKW